MKLRILLASCLAAGSSLFAQSVSQMVTDAQRAYLSGDLASAKRQFTEVLRVDPRNSAAANYLRMIDTAEKKNPASKLANDLQLLTLPTVELKDANFGSALDYLKQQASKQSVAVSFVTQVPKEALEEKMVSVSLRNIPFLEALRYVCNMGGAKFSLEKYAVVIEPKAPGEQASAAPAAQ